MLLRAHARLQAHHLQRDGVERRAAEFDRCAERRFRRGRRGREPPPGLSQREHEGRVRGGGGRLRLERCVARVVVLVWLEEHGLQKLHQRGVEEVETVSARLAVVAVAVSRPVGREQHVARLHGDVDAVHHRIGAGLGVEDQAQRIGRVAVRARPFARHDHLVGGYDGAHGAVGVGFGRIDQDEVAPFGELGVEQAARGVERAARLLVAPMAWLKRLARARPQRRRRLVPARAHGDLFELAIKLLKRAGLRQFLTGRSLHGLSSLRMARFQPPLPCFTGTAMRPTRAISMVTVSPPRTGPTPSGVPVAMTSPGSSVDTDEASATMLGMSTIRSRVLACWRKVSLTHSFISRSLGSPTSSAVTSAGPMGVNVSYDLRITRSSLPRTVMSIRQEYPKMWSRAASTGM